VNEDANGQASGTGGGAGIGGEFIGDLARRLAASLPEGARVLREDLAANFEALLQSAFARLDLVTREEFEVQQRVLAATREKLTRLEQALDRLEAGAGEPGRPD
jgi:BMFP domain-containing protein YqiC